MDVATVVASHASRTLEAAAPAVSVVVSTHNRAPLLSGLLDALDTQLGIELEVIVVDNGSSDNTWELLAERCRLSSTPLLALRVDAHDGPGIPRNTAVTHARAPVIAFTDDDCLPAPMWAAALGTPLGDPGVAVVVGRTLPEPGGWGGPWGRTVEVTAPTGLFETANLAVRRADFELAGGFRRDRLLTGRAFGEDAVLGSTIARNGRVEFQPEALVHHRVMPQTYLEFVTEHLRLAGFAGLVGEVPELRARLFGGIFLSRRTAVVDLGLVGLLAAGISRRAVPALAAIPWLMTTWRDAGGRPGRPRPVRAAQIATADLAGAVALVRGSIRARCPVL